MKKIPWLLIFCRILLGVIILGIALFQESPSGAWLIAWMSIGAGSDVLDGIVARRLHLSSAKLSTWDSNADQIFWLLTVTAAFFLHFSFLKENILLIGTLFVLEFLAYLISFFRFVKR